VFVFVFVFPRLMLSRFVFMSSRFSALAAFRLTRLVVIILQQIFVRVVYLTTSFHVVFA
jgi:hypothetical protein